MFCSHTKTTQTPACTQTKVCVCLSHLHMWEKQTSHMKSVIMWMCFTSLVYNLYCTVGPMDVLRLNLGTASEAGPRSFQ